jgi:hypothetical protein
MMETTISGPGPNLLQAKKEARMSGVAKHSTVMDHMTPFMSLRIISAFRTTLNQSNDAPENPT